jgi:hypothetical protein
MTRTKAKTIADYEEQIGELSVRALRVGDEELLDAVTADLGVATRHLERVRAGVLSLNDEGIRAEIDASFDRAESRVSIWPAIPAL